MRKKPGAFLSVVLLAVILSACAGEPQAAPAAEAEPESQARSEASALPEPGSRAEPSSREESSAPSAPESSAEEVSAQEQAASAEEEPDEEDIFPYLPQPFDPFERLPVLYHFDGQHAPGNNNRTVEGVSFFLDEALFQARDTDYDYFGVYEAVEGSPVGPCVLSVVAQHYTTLNVLFADSDGVLDPVRTLNTALESFLVQNPGETFTYFSEEVNGRYIPAALFVTDNALGFIYYVTDGETILSLQFLSYNSDYAQPQREVMSDLLASISFH